MDPSKGSWWFSSGQIDQNTGEGTNYSTSGEEDGVLGHQRKQFHYTVRTRFGYAYEL